LNLSFLLYLACPLSMGVMMWMMMRGNQDKPTQNSPAAPPATDVAGLRSQLDSLEAQQRAIRVQMQRLVDEDAIEGKPEAPALPGGLEGATTKQAG